MHTLARGQCIQLYSQGGNCCAASGCRRCSNLLLLLSVSVCCTLIQVGPGNYISGGTRISQERGIWGGHFPAYYKVSGIPGVRSIFSTLFGRWQQRCGLWLAVLQQPVIITVVELIGWHVAELLNNRERNVPIQLAQFWFHGLVTSNAKI